MDKEVTTSNEEILTEVNGRYDFKNSGANPISGKKVTYYNSKTDKMQSQQYLEMEDIVIPVILKQDEDGKRMFGMQYEYMPSAKRVLLELPDCPFFSDKKGKYTRQNVSECVEDRILEMGLDLQGLKFLNEEEFPISQSFTDQLAKVVVVYVKEDKNINNQLIWFPLTSMKDYFSNIGSYSSLQTVYALKSFYHKYKEDIDKLEQTEFEVDTEMLNDIKLNWMNVKNILPHQYRFGLESAKMQQNKKSSKEGKIANFGNVTEYGLSKDSVQCLVVRRKNDKVKVGLSKQLRSPFIEREGVDEYFYEAAAGMVEDGENYEQAAIRETLEETGIKIKRKINSYIIS